MPCGNDTRTAMHRDIPFTFAEPGLDPFSPGSLSPLTGLVAGTLLARVIVKAYVP